MDGGDLAGERQAVAALFQNHQWAVTEDGVKSIKPAPIYPIEAHRLLERRGVGEGKFYDWPLHMARKNWVDIEAFIEAFSTALQLHAGKYKGKVDPDMLQASIFEARRETEKEKIAAESPLGSANSGAPTPSAAGRRSAPPRRRLLRQAGAPAARGRS
jgi:hypothetical protein